MSKLPWSLILSAIGGFAFAFGTKAGASWLRARGKTDLEIAQERVERAMKTADTKDDADALVMRENARRLKATLDAFADSLEQAREVKP